MLRAGMSTERLSIDDYFISMAELVGSRSTCLHRHQGVVLVRDKRVIATGYNGSPPGSVHCTDLGYCLKTQSEGLYCRAEGLHGESNSIASAAKMGISTNGAIAYCVYSPCRSCCNLLKSAGIVEVVFSWVYDSFVDGPKYLKELGIKVREA
jgi:dCMP deaminase